jgi:outer membrane protein TolC
MELQTLESTDTLDEEQTISQNPSLSFGVRQPLFMNGRLIDMRVFDASREVAELRYERAQTGAEASTNGQLQSALQQYVQVLTLRRQRSRLQESLSVAERRVEQAEVSRAEGQQSEQQVLSARVNANRQREQLLNTRYALRQAETALAKALGIGTALEGVELADRLSVPRPQGSIEELVDRALQANNRLRQLRIAERIAKQQEILDGQKDSPSLSANVNLEPRYPDQRDDEDALGDSFSSFFEDTAGVNWNVTLQLQIPLSEQKEKRLRGRKNALALDKQEISTADYRTEIRKTIDTLVTRDELLRERIALLETDVEYQKRRVENQQSRVELSTAPELSVDQLELELRARENTLFQARTDLFLNRLRLYSLIGEELPAVLEQAYSD